MGDDHGLMRGFINLGALHNAMKQPDQALRYFEKARYRAQLTGEEAILGTIHMNMGHAYLLTGDFATSEAHTRQAEAIFTRYANMVELARVWNNLGMACFYQGKWEEARFHLDASLRQWRTLNNTKGELDTLVDIIEFERATGNTAQALARLREVEALLGPNPHHPAYHSIHPVIEKYRRSLTE
jgi:tetratricopeptide (TPR) repeat protein